MAEHALLTVENLSVEFHARGRIVQAVRNVSWQVNRGETLAILGESGSGKSVSSSAVMGLIDSPPGHITSGKALFQGRDLLTLTKDERREINGRRIAMIFQDPLAHLNPVYPVGWQVAEAMRVHGVPPSEARARAVALLERVGIPRAAERHGGGDEARSADRGRTDDGTGCDGAGADPDPAVRVARRDGHGTCADHP